VTGYTGVNINDDATVGLLDLPVNWIDSSALYYLTPVEFKELWSD